MSVEEMARKLNISKAEVRAHFESSLNPQQPQKKTCRPFTADEDRQLITLRENNETLRAIASKLGRPEGSVFNRLRRIYAEM
jgi:DNA-binding Lrp family transcriptional regulator